jgi:hypothetical protein
MNTTRLRMLTAMFGKDEENPADRKDVLDYFIKDWEEERDYTVKIESYCATFRYGVLQAFWEDGELIGRRGAAPLPTLNTLFDLIPA